MASILPHRIFQVKYLGSSELDNRHTVSMLPWMITEVKRRQGVQNVTLQVRAAKLKATIMETGQVVFVHDIKDLFRFTQTHQDNSCFAYLYRTPLDFRYQFHVFQSHNVDLVSELFQAIRQEATTIPGDCSPSDSTAEWCTPGCRSYEVSHVANVRCPATKTSVTFLDEVLKKLQKGPYQTTGKSRRKSDSSVPAALRSPLQGQSAPVLLNTHRMSMFPAESVPEEEGGPMLARKVLRKAFLKRKAITIDGTEGTVVSADPDSTIDEEGEVTRRPRAATGPVHDTRTALFVVGDHDVKLISLDHKALILERRFKDISFCLKGKTFNDHFGFISREPSGGYFLCHIFRCSSEVVVEEVLQALRLAFETAFQESNQQLVVCENCPMHQYHRLCQELEGVAPAKALQMLHQRINLLPDKEQATIMHRLKREGPASISEQVEVLMILLRHVCETRQQQHVHLNDASSCSSSSRSAMLQRQDRLDVRDMHADPHTRGRPWTVGNHRALSRSFSQDSTPYSPDGSPPPRRSPPAVPVPPRIQVHEPPPPAFTPPRRPRSSTVGTLGPNDTVRNPNEQPSSPTNDTGPPGEHNERPRDQRRLSRAPPRPAPPRRTPSTHTSNGPLIHTDSQTLGHPVSRVINERKGSWRFNILTRISKSRENSFADNYDGSLPARVMNSRTIRAMWRKAILETLLLIRMERENVSLKEKQDAVETRRIKLDYEEITPCLKDVTQEWERMLREHARCKAIFPYRRLHDAVKAGVPQRKRGEIWRLLVAQHQQQHPEVMDRLSVHPDINTAYEQLLRQLTLHQHAILIDLGRTFPSHPYFARQLGAGQLSLFNLLKAYSLVDSQVGYCQGLSFVSGILLMHMPELGAFETMKHMMFHLNFRCQYQPDMTALQIQMYQLSRLLHDNYPDLYNHLDTHEIGPTLYAAPWFLTLFASQFPIGFVARVFDLIFLQGMEVVFKVALVLLGNHKELIKEYDSLEGIVEFLKTTLPEMGIIQMERVINQVFQLDLTDQLRAYEVEYHVLQEEMMPNNLTPRTLSSSSSTSSSPTTSSLTSPPSDSSSTWQNIEASQSALRRQNHELLEQLQAANSTVLSLEAQVSCHLEEQNRLKSHIRTLELERAALLHAITTLRSVVPEQTLQKIDLSIPAISPELTINNSPIHNPIVNRIVEENAIKLRSGVSLTELDREVAALTKRKLSGGGPNPPRHLMPNQDINRPTSQ